MVVNQNISSVGNKILHEISQNDCHNAFLLTYDPAIFELHEFNVDDIELATDRLNNSQSSSVEGITSYMNS